MQSVEMGDFAVGVPEAGAARAMNAFGLGGTVQQRLAAERLIIAGNALDLEQGTGVVAPDGLLHVLLETEERRTLGEEDGQGRGGDVGQVMAAVVPRAPVRQSGGASTPALDKMIENSGARSCATSMPVPPQKYKLQTCDDCNEQVNLLA